MIIQAEFQCSNTDWKKCPKADLPEFAFIGRSNVGKSSLINALANNKKLAKTSSTPGKTRLINHFLVDKRWFLVDLPGYGYAKASKKSRHIWGEMSSKYLQNRENLMCTFVLIDVRLEPQKNDLEFINWCGEKQLPIAIIFTKSDKLKAGEIQSNIAGFEKSLLEYWEELPPRFLTSSVKKNGLAEILEYINGIIS
ncbi:MAG: YihA family ribosome biogenesis GTP-binding protein [Marinilabiliales bacterium]|nr:MAG: YihA family ribosome biogenesis GTP-binding protein [Marinilabiliales bacterium]